MEFKPMPKTPRLSREVIITEKIDGTNASVFIQLENDAISEPGNTCPLPKHYMAKVGDLVLCAGSRTRWITPDDDNYGFARWVHDNAQELATLGVGHHFGEWWGKGINRAYGRETRQFSLFNVGRWKTSCSEAEGLEPAPGCCGVVPTLWRGDFGDLGVETAMSDLRKSGSVAAPGFMDPEGIMVFHTAANMVFKKTLKGDDAGKSFEGHVKKPPKVRPPKDPSRGGRRKAVLDTYRGPFRRETDPEELK